MAAPEDSPPSAVERAYRMLKSAILANDLQAGRPISDQKIAAELGVSRTPVREALQLLQHEGYVAISPRRGVHVLPIKLSDLHAIYEVITALELYAIRLTGLRPALAEELAAMDEACRRMRASVENDMDAWSSADEAFHQALLAAPGNPILREQGVHHWQRVSRAHRVALRLRDKPRKSTEAHSKVTALILAGRSEEAVVVHCAQRERSGQELADAITKIGLTEL
ncbi:GntR family transcriptional regulator [Acuticoccus sp. M5D2P5]|uniref:GntR family transcriptional regulator n=1 Tax=Acuticoccus kalidii TaxID=2910977 RepID=UPI001F1614F1|nr:GntR family transcriptional regulator [Acuticoccus kalidii]MCF3933437.1 GntR family transcriptional regulator [Acuticoccus kalidii]